METIKSYLESMFATMPNTEDVRKAKAELLQMMDDKYTELIEEGVSENEAVGTVISEFGNLDEVAESLGLKKVVEQKRVNDEKFPRRPVSFDEIVEYLHRKEQSGVMIGLGVALFITCVCFPILSDAFGKYEGLGVAAMFIAIGLGVGIIIFNEVTLSTNWGFLKDERCQIDMTTADYVASERKKYSVKHALRLSVGIVLICISWIGPAACDGIPVLEDASEVALFIFVAVGVWLLIMTNTINGSYEKVLRLNDIDTVSGAYGDDRQVKYINKTVETIMAVYWPTITCVYFIWSFISFDWHITWLIWPIAAIIHTIMKINLVEEA